MSIGTLYRLDFQSGKSYIGVTTASAALRYSRHAGTCRAGNKCVLYGAWRKYGAPKMQILAYVEKHMLPEVERKAIVSFGTLVPDGYNMTPGGEISPTTVPEIAARMAAANRGKKRPDVTGMLNPMHRPEVRALFLGHLNAMSRDEVAEKMRGANNPSKRPEGRAKIAASKKGMKFSEEHCRRMSEVRIGRKLSDAHRAAISMAGMGRKQSIETVAKRLKTFQHPEIAARIGWKKGKKLIDGRWQ